MKHLKLSVGGWAAACMVISGLAVFTLPGPLLAQETAPSAPAPDDAARVAALKQKLESTVIEKVNFDHADLGTVLQFLSQKSKELDPDKQGVNFVLRTNPGPGAPNSPPARTISITLDRISLADLLTEIAGQTRMLYSVEAYAVYLRPVSSESEPMSVRTFLVPGGFFDTAPGNVTSSSAEMQKFWESKGIKFPAGATATFIPESNKLVVRNTSEQLDAIFRVIGS